MHQPVPSLSIIIEWENAGRIGAARARRMLAALHRQLGALGGGGHELILVHDPAKASRAALEESLRTVAPEADWPARIRFVAAPGGGYYEQKNRGAAGARREIIVFLDSDVVPQEGWLAALVAPFADPQVGVVGGNTFVEHDGLYSAAFAIAWFFPLPSSGHGIEKSRGFFANNVAFRREIFAAHNFPETGQYRGQCGFLAEALGRAGHQVYLSREARVAHPPPEGLRHFLVRALWNGHDDSLRQGGGVRRLAREYGGQLKRIGRDHDRVGLGLAGAAGASLLASAYYALRLAGYLGARAAPNLVRRTLTRADI